MPSGRVLTGFSHEYKRHGTTTLFAALDILKGQVTKRRKRRQLLDSMDDILQDINPAQEVHVILDNLNTHMPKRDVRLSFYY